MFDEEEELEFEEEEEERCNGVPLENGIEHDPEMITEESVTEQSSDGEQSNTNSPTTDQGPVNVRANADTAEVIATQSWYSARFQFEKISSKITSTLE